MKLRLGRLAVGIPTTQVMTASLVLVRMLHDAKMPLPILTNKLHNREITTMTPT